MPGAGKSSGGAERAELVGHGGLAAADAAGQADAELACACGASHVRPGPAGLRSAAPVGGRTAWR